ncbi:MAG: sulfur carrier protein ThiS [Spirochaetales bacterium]|nr:sulfur carrier protein ThiS [Spirochaetales bacterium]
MTITINGEKREITETLTVMKLLQELKLNPDVTIVEQNAEIVSRADYETRAVNENDSLELLRYMGGG